ncbi:MAG: DNRLRE domain-containing protein, partial [Acidimicrobiia bacterium]|nr:DNRLRE domain-containing protein [Acidimicrobiia bacterium]
MLAITCLAVIGSVVGADSILRWTQAEAASTVFQSGLNGYTGTVDTFLDEANPTTSHGTDTLISVGLSDVQQGLIRFDGIFGSGAGQIPLGSTITSASLSIEVTDPGGGSVSVHSMKQAWPEASTWDSTGAGIQPDDVEAAATPDLVFPDTGLSGGVTISGLEGALQAWSDGAPNYGWVLYHDSTDGWGFRSSDASPLSERPSLIVTYTANRSPVLDQDHGDRSDPEGTVVSLANSATDLEGDPLTWSAVGLPPGLSIDPWSGLVSGWLTYATADGSPYAVTIRVEDSSGGFDEDTFVWTIGETPTSIGISKSSDVSGRAQPGDVIGYTITVTNPEPTPATAVAVSDPVPAGSVYVPGSGTFSLIDAARDSFESGGYFGDDGTIPWSGTWLELDGEANDVNLDGVIASPFCSAGSCLFVEAAPASETEGMERRVDLSGATSAT